MMENSVILGKDRQMYIMLEDGSNVEYLPLNVGPTLSVIKFEYGSIFTW